MSALDVYIGRVRSLRHFATDVAKASAPLILDAVKATANAGTDFDGRPWPPKKDGSRALVNASKALSVKTTGPLIILTLIGIEVFHNMGASNLPVRRILPDGGAGVPKKISAIVNRVASRLFQRAVQP